MKLKKRLQINFATTVMKKKHNETTDFAHYYNSSIKFLLQFIYIILYYLSFFQLEYKTFTAWNKTSFAWTQGDEDYNVSHYNNPFCHVLNPDTTKALNLQNSLAFLAPTSSATAKLQTVWETHKTHTSHITKKIHAQSHRECFSLVAQRTKTDWAEQREAQSKWKKGKKDLLALQSK